MESKGKRSLTIDDFPDEIIFESKTDHFPPPEPAFESNEHRDMGNFAFLQFCESLPDNVRQLMNGFLTDDAEMSKVFNPISGQIELKTLRRFFFTKDLTLSPGEIVALAGDFFAHPDPIAFGKTDPERDDRFEHSFAELMKTKEDDKKLRLVIAHIEDDAKGTSPHAHWSIKFVKEKVKQKAEAALDLGNIRYAIEMADEKSLSGFWHSPYFDLAIKNFDHFGDEAREAYLAGHRTATSLARKAGAQKKGSKEQSEMLRDALLRELFALHFLTDLFAGGHIRTPRKEILNFITAEENVKGIPDLPNISSLNLTVAGFFARKMHDEDGDKGVWVHSAANNDGKGWKAKGDGNYYAVGNQENAQIALRVMLLALQDVLQAFDGVTHEKLLLGNYEKLKPFIPEPYPATAQYKNQPKPMFYLEGNQLYCRGDLFSEIKKDGLFSGIAQGVPCIPIYRGLMAARFFNVSVKHAEKVASAGRDIVNAVEEKVENLVELAADGVQELVENLEDSGATCTML